MVKSIKSRNGSDTKSRNASHVHTLKSTSDKKSLESKCAKNAILRFMAATTKDPTVTQLDDINTVVDKATIDRFNKGKFYCQKLHTSLKETERTYNTRLNKRRIDLHTSENKT